MALPKLESVKYEIVIPSTQKRVEFRPYTVKEEKVLLIAKESGDGRQMVRATRDLIDACTMGTIKSEELTMFDFEYLFLQIRGRSVGESSDIRLKCDNCGVRNDVSINVTEAKVANNTKKDMKVMVNDQIGMMLKYPSFASSENLVGKDLSSPEVMIEVVASCIDSIFDQDSVYPAEDQSKEELIEFIESLPTTKFKEVSAMFEGMPTVELDASYKCMSCGEMNELTLKGLSNFF